ncbi:RHS repeat-associated core domain-containing protein, partial [Flavobacterium jumunjinense]
CLKLHTYTHLHIAHTSNTEHSREKKSDAGRYQYKYNGKELQTELGLNMYDMDMRDYDPAIGRWVNQDPIVHFGMSPYSAFDNNPVFWADPSGADSEMPSWMQDAWNNSGSGTTHWVNNGNGEFKKAKQNKKLGGPGFDFDSIDTAAIDFAMQYNGISIINKTELGAAIYKKKNGKYSYTSPKGQVVYSKSAKKNKGTVYPILFGLDDVPDFAELAGLIHTHGDEDDPGDNKLQSDSGDTAPAQFGGGIDFRGKRGVRIPVYLVTPNGQLFVHDVYQKGGSPIRSTKKNIGGVNIPSQPGSTGRVNLVSPNVRPLVDPTIIDSSTGLPLQLRYTYDNNK